jgi:uncharacterized protein (UPF0128 family)
MQIQLIESELYLKETKETTNLKGIFYWDENQKKYIELNHNIKLKPGMKLSIDGKVYEITDKKTDIPLDIKFVAKTSDGLVIKIGEDYFLEKDGKRRRISQDRAKNLASNRFEAVITLPQAKHKQSVTSQGQQTSNQEEQRSQSRDVVKTVSGVAYALTGARIYLEDKSLYGKTLLSIAQEVYGVEFKDTDHLRNYIKERKDLFSLWLRDLLSIGMPVNLTLGQIASAREELNKWLNSIDIKEPRFQYPEAIRFLLRLEYGITDIDQVYQTLRQKDALAKEKLREFGLVSQYEKLDLMSRYGFITHVLPYIDRLREYSYLKSNEYAQADEQRIAETLSILLTTQYYQIYPSFEKLVEATRNLDALDVGLLAVSGVLNGLSNSTKSYGLAGLDRQAYLAQLDSIIARNLSNYAEAIASSLGFGGPPKPQVRGNNLSTSLDFKSVQDIIEQAATNPQAEIQIPKIRSSTRGGISPQLIPPDIGLYSRSLSQNALYYAFYKPRYRYDFENEWVTFKATGGILYTRSGNNESGSGSIVADLIGTSSSITAIAGYKDSSIDLTIIAKDIDEFRGMGFSNVNGVLSLGPQKVSAEVKAELDKLDGDVAIFYSKSNNKEEGYLYARIGTDWYRVGRINEQWIASMNKAIPGFGDLFADVRVGNGISAVVSLSMLSGFSFTGEFKNNDIKAIGAYLLSPNSSSKTILGMVSAPQLVFAGYYKGNVVAGGQFVSNDNVLNVLGYVGKDFGIEIRFANPSLATELRYDNNDIVAKALANLGGVEGIVQFYSGNGMMIGAGAKFGKQYYELLYLNAMEKEMKAIAGPYADLFKLSRSALWGYANLDGKAFGALVSSDIGQYMFGANLGNVSATATFGNAGSGASVNIYWPEINAVIGAMYRSIGNDFQLFLRRWAENLGIGAALRINDKGIHGAVEVEFDSTKLYGTYSDGTIGLIGQRVFYITQDGSIALIPTVGVSVGAESGYLLGVKVGSKTSYLEGVWARIRDKEGLNIRASMEIELK